MNIPFINLQTQYERNKKAIDNAVSKVLSHGQYIMGPEVTDLERELGQYIGVEHVLACSSGTDALVLPLMAKNLNKNDAIFTTPFTFFASAESISLAGATPVFVDIDPKTYNICPIALENSIQKTIAEGTLIPKGVMPVDLFGLAADYDKVLAVAKSNNLFVIEDAAQSFGANYKDRKACSFGNVAATSFYPAKPLGCYGDGGAVFTDDTELYQELLSLRVHGQAKSGDKYDNTRIGLNARMDTIQAAILLEKLKIYDEEIEKRNHVAQLYTEQLNEVVQTPYIPEGQESVWAQYSIQSNKRSEIISALKEKNIPTAIFYPTPIHLSSAYKNLNYSEGDFPISESASKCIFSLPMHPYLDEKDVKTITDTIKRTVAA